MPRLNKRVNHKKKSRSLQKIPKNSVGLHLEYSSKELSSHLKNAASNDLYLQTQSAVYLRRVLSKSNAPIDQIIHMGWHKHLTSFLSSKSLKLKLEAVWALGNLSCGTTDDVRQIINAGAVKGFLGILCCKQSDKLLNAKLIEEVIWALGNICADSTECRDLVLKEQGILLYLLTYLNERNDGCSISIIRDGTFMLDNCFRGKKLAPNITPQAVEYTVATISYILFYHEVQVLKSCCWVLFYICKYNVDSISSSTVITRRLIELILHPEMTVHHAALRVIGNIVSGGDEITDRVVQLGVVACIATRLKESNCSEVIKEICFALSNIAAGTSNQIQHLLDADVVSHLISIYRTSEPDIREEILWVITNSISGGTIPQVLYLVRNCGILAFVPHTLHETQRPEIVSAITRALARVQKLLKTCIESGNSYIKEHEHRINTSQREMQSSNISN